MRFYRHCAVLAAVLLLAGYGCAGHEEEPAPLADTQSDAAVASAGTRSIDWRLLQRSFQLDARWQRGQTREAAYRLQLDYLIDQKLLAQEALANGALQDPALAGYLQAIQEKEMIKELYRREVASRVEISEETYRQAYRYSKKKVQFEYITTPDLERARIYLQQLRRLPLGDIVLKDAGTDEKGVSPMFGFGDVAEELEPLVFEMEAQEVGGPVEVEGNFMVVKVVDGQVEKFMSEIDYATEKSRIKRVLFDRRAGDISNAYIESLLKDENVRINPRAFTPLARKFAEIVENKTSAEPFPVYVSDRELHTVQAQLADLGDAVLVSFNAGQLTVKEFLTRLQNMPNGIRPKVNMAPHLRKAIAGVVRNYYLAAEARRQGLDQSPEVLYEVQAQQDEALAIYWSGKIRRRLAVSAEEVAEFKQKEKYAEVNQRLNGTLDDQRVRQIILDVKFARRQIEIADSLRGVYSAAVDSLQLRALVKAPDEMINETPVGFAYREQFQ